MNETIEIHYNFFETIEEQLKKQGYKCENIEMLEDVKKSIFYLWIHNFISDKEKTKCINKLHKEILKNIK